MFFGCFWVFDFFALVIDDIDDALVIDDKGVTQFHCHHGAVLGLLRTFSVK